VVTTDATTGATAALLLPGTQNITHEDLRACALAALRMVWASAAWMAVEMLATWCVRKLRGDARPSPYVCPSELTISFAYVYDAK